MMMMTMMRRCPVTLLILFLVYQGSNADTHYYVKLKADGVTKIVPSVSTIKDSMNEKSRAMFNLDDESMIHDTLKANHERRNSFHETSTFDPDVLNKFLDEYANKMKSTTEKSVYSYPFPVTTKQPIVTSVEIVNSDKVGASTSTEDTVTINGAEISLENIQALNDTTKRNKYYNSNTNDDRNGGWVTLEAIPWSKSKISKWQANPSSQQSWPDTKWDKPTSGKPWPIEQSSRPHHENNKPWYDKPKPYWSEYQSDQPKPMLSSRPSYSNNRFDSNSNQAEKWPPEKPNHSSWNDFYRPSGDIITDNGPPNFPTNNWDRYDQVSRPTYSSFNDRYINNQHNEANNDWPTLNHPNNKFEHVQEKPSYMRPHNQRPYFSGQYEYESNYRPSHPSNGDGQWILLSTNRGYSKSRQRSIQFDNMNNGAIKSLNGTLNKMTKAEGTDSVIPVMTSKRQVRLTVLPSKNGTNTTTSHGGLLEVEKTFKTVDESQQEYEQSIKLASNYSNIIGNRRPIGHTALRRPLNSAVLAAVGAGMLPATMAMVLPMMLGRKKRSTRPIYIDNDGNCKYIKNININDELSARCPHIY